jgi:hypothetical protein
MDRASSFNGSGGGFVNPYARSVSATVKSAPVRDDAGQAPARRAEPAKETGGFVNPAVRQQ